MMLAETTLRAEKSFCR